MSPAEPTKTDRVESRLRAEAMTMRRPAPAGFADRVLARIEPGGAIAPASPGAFPLERSVPRWSGRTIGAVGLAAAAAVLAMLQMFPGADVKDVGPGPITRIANLFDASRIMRQTAFTGTPVERPLLAELEALGQDTARAAAALAQDLPGPVGRLFDGK